MDWPYWETPPPGQDGNKMPQRVADYFVIAGLEFENAESLRLPGEASRDVAPITDICILNANENEQVPPGYVIVGKTVAGNPADLNHGSFNAPCMYICFKRDRDTEPIVDIEVVNQENPENPNVVDKTPYGRSANVNNGTTFNALPLYIKVIRNIQSQFVITDLAIMLPGKGEEEPLGYTRLNENLNRGMVGSDVFICFKRRPKSVHRASYRPSLLTRLPRKDHCDTPLIDCSQFALPSGACLEAWTSGDVAINSQPEFSTFVLTTETHECIYGASLVFLERINADKLTDAMKRRLGLLAGNNQAVPGSEKNQIYMTKAIALLSKHPFFETFEIFLKFLYQMSVSNSIQKISIERHLSLFMTLPFPSPRCPRINAYLSPHHPIHLSLPRYRPLPPSGASFTLLLYNLGTEKVISLFYHVLTQHKILVHTLNIKDLTPCVEAIAAMIFPLKWQCPFIPLCPIEMATCIESPMPVLMGISTTYFDEKDNEPDSNTVYIVSLDNGPLRDVKRKYKLLPSKLLDPLMNSLKNIEKNLRKVGKKRGFGLDDPDDDDRREHFETALRQEFLKFMCNCLGKYRNYLKPIKQRPSTGATDLNMLFSVDAFIHHNSHGSKTNLEFYRLFTQSQAFCMFIEGRTFSLSETAIQQIEYFDDCQDKLSRVSQTSELIDSGTPNDEETRKIVPPPEDEGEYQYSMFPIDLEDIDEGQVTKLDTVEKHPGLRTPMELKLAAMTAYDYHSDDKMWPFLLKSYYYGLYFLYLPSYAKTTTSVTAAFREGISTMERMSVEQLGLPDEAPIRFLLMSCLEHQKPMTAVRIFTVSNRALKMDINAATYGLYNKVLLDAKWPSSNRDGYTLWRLLRNVVLGVTAFMKPINVYRSFQAPSPPSHWNLEMGLQHGRSCSRSMDGVIAVKDEPNQVTLVGCKNMGEPEDVFEPRKVEDHVADVDVNVNKTQLKKQNSIIRLSEAKSDDGESENEALQADANLTEAERPAGALPKPNLLPDEALPKPNLLPDESGATKCDSISNNSAVPPVIPAFPRQVQSRSTWSLPKSMSDFSVSKLNLPNLSNSPTLKSVLSSPSVSKFKDFSSSSIKSVNSSIKSSPSLSNIRDKTNKYLTSATKEIDKFSVAVNRNLSAYYDGESHQDTPEENSSEDSLMEDEKRKSSSLPRPPRAKSLDRLSMKSDATGSVKSQVIPDISVVLSVGSLCNTCNRPLYEEEIMSGWSHDPSCMMTQCCWCTKRTRPDISVEIYDRRSDTTRHFTHPFISPIVLRKEIDTLVSIGDEEIMRTTAFIDNHPTQFWNLVYAFQRICLKHNLDQLIPHSKILQSDISDEDSGSHSMDSGTLQVVIQLSWDSNLINNAMSHPPLYRVFKEYQKPPVERNSSVMQYQYEFLQTIVEAIKTNDCHAPLFKLLYEFDKTKNGFISGKGVDTTIRRSCYREALFLLIVAVGQENIEIPLFDSHWYKAHSQLPKHAAELKVLNDQTPSFRTYTLRHYFKELPLLH